MKYLFSCTLPQWQFDLVWSFVGLVQSGLTYVTYSIVHLREEFWTILSYSSI